MKSNPYTRALLQGEGRLERLKKSQEDYFSELIQGKYDKDYIEKRLRVGQVHQMVGLEPIYYLAAYNQYVQITFPKFAEAFSEKNQEGFSSLLSLVKVIFFDIALALDTYFKTNTFALRKRNEELQRALGMYLQSQRREEQYRQLLSHEFRGALPPPLLPWKCYWRKRAVA